MGSNKEFIKKVIYNSGDVFLPERIKNFLKKDIIGSTNKTFYITWWSIIHFINGIIVGALYLHYNYNKKHYFLAMLSIHTLWEVWQIVIGMSNPMKTTGRGNIVDIILDTLLFMLGAYICFVYW